MILPWKTGKVLIFKRMDIDSHPVAGYVSIGWRLTDEPSDPWTARFQGFKDGRADAVRGARAVMGQAVSRVKFAEEGETALVSAIGHNDTSLRAGSPLARLGPSIAEAKGWMWEPNGLSKRRHRSLKLLGSGADRDSEVEGVYQADTRILADYGTVVILDDFFTRGATTQQVVRAVRAVCPDARVACIGLGKNERVSWARSCGHDIGNSHIPAEWADAWDSA